MKLKKRLFKEQEIPNIVYGQQHGLLIKKSLMNYYLEKITV
ncbi:hypothetical protein HNR33_004268 [Brassicibacter mesophilus]